MSIHKPKYSYVYLITNKWNTTLYVGVTSDLIKRMYQHKEKIFEGFSAEYNLNKLVWFEVHEDINEAIKREKQIKAGSRKKKLDLINGFNPEWKDLYGEII